jgi:hypothetical protein
VISGLQLFARYAFAPNRLGYCGPSDHAALAGYLAEGTDDGGLLGLATRFEGAYPYLQLIARTNAIADPFDRRVVEAYWVGNTLLARVGASSLYESLKDRFRSRMSGPSFTSLVSHLGDGMPPHHNFHVFEIYRRAGLLRDERASIALDRMDQCRISWGRVRAAESAELVVERAPLALAAGKITLGRPAVVRIRRRLGAAEGAGVTDGTDAADGPQTTRAPRAGDWVSIHWGWACDLLAAPSLRALQAVTRRAVAHANLTI